MADLKSTRELLKDMIYDWLWKEFLQFAVNLSNEQRTEFDGLLWQLAEKLAAAGMWRSLQDTLGIIKSEKAAGA